MAVLFGYHQEILHGGILSVHPLFDVRCLSQLSGIIIIRRESACNFLLSGYTAVFCRILHPSYHARIFFCL